MDHSYAATTPFHALPTEITATGARIVSFLHSGGRSVVLVGEHDTGKTTTLDAVLAGMPAWVERISNRIPQPLTLARILAQVGAQVGGDGDTVAASDRETPAERGLGATLVRLLADRAGPAQPAVLAIDDAHTLTPDALAALAKVPGLGGPDLPGMVLLLAGEPALLGLLHGAGLGRLRGAATLTLRMPTRHGNPAADGSSREDDVSRRWPYMAAAAAITLLATALLLRPATVPGPVLPHPVEPAAIARPSPLPPQAAPMFVTPEPEASPAALQPPVPPPAMLSAPIPEPQAVAPQPAAAQPDPVPMLDTAPRPIVEPASEPDVPRLPPVTASPKRVPTEMQLRHDFDAFLNRAGRDTAQLTTPAREALFREYLQWRAHPAP